MSRPSISIVWAVMVVLVSSCASLRPDFETPKVSLESFKPLPNKGGAPRFEIKMRIINPNAQTFDVAGISYGVEIQGRELMSGVTSEVPLLEGYSEQVVTLEAGLQWLQLLRLLTEVGKDAADRLDYRFTAKIDFNGFIPTQRVEEAGTFTLNPPSSPQ